MLITDKETLAHLQNGADIAREAVDEMTRKYVSTESLASVAAALHLLATGIEIIVETKYANQ